MNELMSDGLLAIVAGSDTTSHVMINAFYFLMKHPEMQERLQREIDESFPPGSSPFDPVKQANMPYLNAVLSVIIHAIEIAAYMGFIGTKRCVCSRLCPTVLNAAPSILARV